MRDEKIAKRLYDRVNCIEGTFSHTEEVSARGHPQLDKAYKIYYYPDVDPFESVRTWIKMMAGMVDPVPLPGKYPEHGFKEFTNDHGYKGQPREVLVVFEDINGNSGFAEKIGTAYDKSVAKLEKEKDTAKTEKDLSELENTTEEEDDDDYKRGGKSRRTPQGEGYDLERRRI